MLHYLIWDGKTTTCFSSDDKRLMGLHCMVDGVRRLRQKLRQGGGRFAYGVDWAVYIVYVQIHNMSSVVLSHLHTRSHVLLLSHISHLRALSPFSDQACM